MIKDNRMKNHWGFWSFWICINATASFVWGNLVIAPSFPSLAGMIIGILFYIIVYAVFDWYLITHNKLQIHQSLRQGVYIKAGLQILNLGLFFGWLISPELWAGIASTEFTQTTLGIQPNIQPFLFTLINTVITGGLLSLLVVALTTILTLINTVRSKGIS